MILRPFELTDAKEVQRLAGDRAIADTTLEIPHPYEDGIAEKWISTHQAKFEAGEMVHFAIILRETNGLIGAIGLTIVPRFERAELGYWIGKPYWGNGYCTEAAWAVLEYGFTTLKSEPDSRPPFQAESRIGKGFGEAGHAARRIRQTACQEVGHV